MEKNYEMFESVMKQVVNGRFVAILLYNYSDPICIKNDDGRKKDQVEIVTRFKISMGKTRLGEAFREKINSWFKRKGVILPFSRSYYVENEIYKNNSKYWKKTKEILAEINSTCNGKAGNFLVIAVIDFSTLPNTLWAKSYAVIHQFCSENDISVVNMYDWFRGKSFKDYCISSIDSHPNYRGHEESAKRAKEILFHYFEEN
jgi:hypothetical protein